MNFTAIDFETANPNLSSICQVGIAVFEDGHLKNSFESLVNPEDYFHPMNVSIHGISEDNVRTSPRWIDLYPAIADLLENKVVVSHTPFDRVAFHRACEKYHVASCHCSWLDSARVVRRTWDCFARSGYGLGSVASFLGIEYRAHDALEDARCAGQILLQALTVSGFTVDQWLNRSILPVHACFADHDSPALGEYEPSPNGALFGEILVFTGSLNMTRHEAADAAARAGCRVDRGVTKHTTILVVGDQDVSRLAGHEKSAKHRKAEELSSKGQKIRILTQTDFQRTVQAAVSAN